VDEHVGALKTRLKSKAVAVGINLMATVAFVVLALTSLRALGYVLATLTLIALAWRARKSGFADTIPGALLVTTAFLIDYHGSAPDAGLTPMVIAGAGIALLIADQPLMQFVMDRPKIQVVNLPGYQASRDTFVSRNTLFATNLAVVALLGVCAVTKITAWPIAAITLVAAAASVTAFAQAARLRLRGLSVDKRLRAALEAYNPEFAFYFNAPPHSEYHVGMWYPYLRRVGKPFIIILREEAPLPIIAAMTDVPVLYCEFQPFVDQVMVPSLKACFYANNGSKNSHMVRFSQLTHIQLLHGDSDKPSSFNPVTAMYDRIFVAGQAGIDRYEANGVLIPAQKFDIVGRPQVETIRVSTDRISAIDNKVVLYATTWVGNYSDASYCSLHLGEQIVRALIARGVTVVLRPHPYARRNLASARQLARIEQILTEDRMASNRQHIFGDIAEMKMSLIDCINAADALISDVSSVASDWLFSEKPFALANVLGEDQVVFEKEFPLAKAAYVLDNEAGNLGGVLDELLETDSMSKIRRECKTYYLGDFPTEEYAQGFIDAAASYVA
jgi:CDP-Glycerol:Poly(glycerophosphate) glycerophosphotransferase